MEQHNVIKRSWTLIRGTMSINMSSGNAGDEIYAMKDEEGWHLLDCKTMKMWYCFPDMLRRFICILEAA
jgi:hypothetical protein